MTHNIKEIERNVEILYKDELKKAAEHILELTGNYYNESDNLFVAYNIENKENGELARYSTF